MTSSPPDWQLPPGVNRGLWEYFHNEQLARAYDADLAGSSLLEVDCGFAERHFDRPGRLLDLGCGTGRLLIPFARRGYTVVGVDLSEEMLQVAREKAAMAGVSLSLIKANVVELDALRDGTFGYAACLFSTLGMIVGGPERRQFIAHVHRLLRPGGKFVLHVHNRWFHCWDSARWPWLVKDLLRSSMGKPGSGDRLMPVHQGVAGLTLHLFTRSEAVRLLREAGFRILEVCPVSLRADGRVPCPGWFGWLRSYGYLLAASR